MVGSTSQLLFEIVTNARSMIRHVIWCLIARLS